MHSPPAEWSLAIGHLAVLDWLRSRGDADFDTLSECLRPWAERHPVVFTGGLGFGACWLWTHILGEHYRLTDRAVRMLDGLRRRETQ